jgi:ATP:cob(I)alamin adenosyltransferase
MGLYSKTRDLLQKEPGETSIVGNKVNKNSAPINFLGDADELNSHLGLVKAMLFENDQKQFLERIQKNIMKLMPHISDITNEDYLLTEDEINILENEINDLKLKFPQQSQFALPGNNVLEAQIHIARAVARRAERHFYDVDKSQICRQAGIYLNRLSDYLFVLSQLYAVGN